MVEVFFHLFTEHKNGDVGHVVVTRAFIYSSTEQTIPWLFVARSKSEKRDKPSCDQRFNGCEHGFVPVL